MPQKDNTIDVVAAKVAESIRLELRGDPRTPLRFLLDVVRQCDRPDTTIGRTNEVMRRVWEADEELHQAWRDERNRRRWLAGQGGA